MGHNPARAVFATSRRLEECSKMYWESNQLLVIRIRRIVLSIPHASNLDSVETKTALRVLRQVW